MSSSWYVESLRQTLTYWAISSKSTFNNPTFVAPVQISGRWEDSKELFIDLQGREVASSAVANLNQVVVEGDYLYLGTSAQADPRNQAGARVIRRFIDTPDLESDLHLRVVYL